MSNQVLTKQFLRELLDFRINWKKNASEAYLMLVEFYGDAAPTDETCREWFQRFKNSDFSFDDKPSCGQTKNFEDKDLQALLDG